jgi:hypothetical protein
MIDNIILFIILMVALMAISLIYGLSVLKADLTEARLRLKEIHHDLIKIADDLKDIRNNLGRLEAVLTVWLAKEAGQ